MGENAFGRSTIVRRLPYIVSTTSAIDIVLHPFTRRTGSSIPPTPIFFAMQPTIEHTRRVSLIPGSAGSSAPHADGSHYAYHLKPEFFAIVKELAFNLRGFAVIFKPLIARRPPREAKLSPDAEGEGDY